MGERERAERRDWKSFQQKARERALKELIMFLIYSASPSSLLFLIFADLIPN
jgi:hypothetical protein